MPKLRHFCSNGGNVCHVCFSSLHHHCNIPAVSCYTDKSLEYLPEVCSVISSKQTTNTMHKLITIWPYKTKSQTVKTNSALIFLCLQVRNVFQPLNFFWKFYSENKYFNQLLPKLLAHYHTSGLFVTLPCTQVPRRREFCS